MVLWHPCNYLNECIIAFYTKDFLCLLFEAATPVIAFAGKRTFLRYNSIGKRTFLSLVFIGKRTFYLKKYYT